MNTLKVIEEYPTHHYIRTYVKTDYYCPQCGKQEVWEDQDPGDHYQGQLSICIACNNRHHLTHCCDSGNNISLRIIKQIKNKSIAATTTPNRN